MMGQTVPRQSVEHMQFCNLIDWHSIVQNSNVPPVACNEPFLAFWSSVAAATVYTSAGCLTT